MNKNKQTSDHKNRQAVSQQERMQQKKCVKIKECVRI